jgi:hypothetical protein
MTALRACGSPLRSAKRSYRTNVFVNAAGATANEIDALFRAEWHTLAEAKGAATPYVELFGKAIRSNGPLNDSSRSASGSNVNRWSNRQLLSS